MRTSRAARVQLGNDSSSEIMVWKPRSTKPAACSLVALVVLALTSAVQARAQDDLYGKHTYPETIEIADRLAGMQPATAWEAALNGEAADLLEFIGPELVLVGVVTADKNAAPRYGPLYLVDRTTGESRWKYDRAKRSGGSYSLLATDPLIVLLGTDGDEAELVGLHPHSGRRQWRTEVDWPFGVAMTNGRLVLAHRDDERFGVRLLDLASGDATADTELPAEMFVGLKQIAIEVTETSAYVIGREVVQINLAAGQRERIIAVPALASGSGSTRPLSDGMLVWDSVSVSYVEWSTGTLRWTSRADPGPIAAVTVAGNGVVLVDGATTSNLSMLDRESGRVVWWQSIGGRVVSPVAVSADLVMATTDSTVVGVRIADGTVAFRHGLPESMMAGSPTSAEIMGLPDILRVEDDALLVARERAGIAAFELPSGALRWYQEHYHASVPLLQYTADGRFASMYATMMLMGQLDPGQPLAPPPSLSSANRSGTTQLLGTAQRHYDNARARYAVGRATATDVQMAAQLGMAATQLEIASGQFTAGMEFARSMMGLVGALREMQRAQGRRGAVHRMELAVQGAMRGYQRQFQGGYYLRPFYYEGWGRGVTVVETGTGLRRDIIFSPHSPPSLAYGLDLPTFTIDPVTQHLVVFGISLRAERYERRGKWGTHVPNFSALGYALDSIEFGEQPTYPGPDLAITLVTALTNGDLQQLRGLLDQGPDVNEWAPQMGQPPIFLAATFGMTEAIQMLLDAGADVNAVNEMGMTAIESPGLPQNSYDALLAAGGRAASGDIPPRPAVAVPPLWIAIGAGQTDRVRRLAERGEGMAWRNEHGETALFFAAAFGRIEIVRALLEAGAEVNATDKQGRTPLDLTTNPEVQAVLRAAGGRNGR